MQGFKAVLGACALISALGVFCIAEGMGLPVGGFLIGLGLVAGTGAYFYEQRSVRTRTEEYERKLVAGFQQIHCRDQRIFEADDSGFTSSCKCGTVTRPWSELKSFSENKTHFAFNTKMGGQVLPKSAFSSDAEITEFRALATGKLNQRQAHHRTALRCSVQARGLPSGLLAPCFQGWGMARLGENLRRRFTICMIYGVFCALEFHCSRATPPCAQE